MVYRENIDGLTSRHVPLWSTKTINIFNYCLTLGSKIP